MIKSILLALTSLLGMAFITSISAAESTAYISDELLIHVRTGPSDGYRIAYYLKSGTPVTLVEEATESGYQRITDPRGRDGWVESKWVTPTASAKQRLAETIREMESLKQQQQRQVATLRQSLNSANAIVEKSRTFQEQISELQTSNTTLAQQNKLLSDRFQQEVFFAGALVLGAGAILGIIIGRFSRKKRSGWS